MEQKVKQHISVDLVLNQGVDPENIHQFLNSKKGVMSPTKPAAEDILAEFGDIFSPNLVN